MATSNKNNALHDINPWKGLNFYKEGEILYGRNKEINSLAQYVINNTQTVLYGRSGIGKSSIINAGVYPIARMEGLYPVGLRLKHEPEVSYIEQIKDAFNESGIGIKELVQPVLETEETLWEYLHRHSFFNKTSGEEVRPLIVFDQFEEIFTLQQNESKKKSFFSELADLINEVTPQYIADATNKVSTVNDNVDIKNGFSLDLGNDEEDNRPGYVKGSRFNLLFCIREDFLSYLERYTSYIPAMKSNRFPLQPINEEQAAEIIMKPREGLVSQEVATLIIEKITGKNDFKLDGTPEIEVDAAVLSLYLSHLYIKKGPKKNEITAGLVDEFGDDIIKEFYEDAVSSLPENEVNKLEERLLTCDGRRNNVSRSDILKEGVSKTVLKTLVEKKKLLRQFSYQDDIRVEFMHDILCPIVEKRIEQRENVWQQEEYIKQQQEERKRIIEKGKKRFYTLLIVSQALGLVILSFVFLFLVSYSDEYVNFTIYNGELVGVGEKLTEDDKKELVVHYRLRKYGFFRPYTEVEILDRNGEKTTNKFVESPLVSLADAEGKDKKASYFSKMQLQTASWKFVADESGKISRQTAYDIDGKVLYSQQYYYSISEADSNLVQSLWLNYLDKSGKPFHVRDNCADRMRVKEKDGYHVGYQFFSETGTPQKNSRNVYGYKYNIEEGIIKSIIPIDEFGDHIDGQSLHFTSFDKYGRWLEAENNIRATYKPDMVVYSMGNVIDTLQYNNAGFLEYRSELQVGKQHIMYRYDTLRNVVESAVYTIGAEGKKLAKSVKSKYFIGSSDIKERITFDSIYSRELFERRGDSLIASYYTSSDGQWSVPYRRNIKTKELKDNMHVTTEIELSCDSTGLENEKRRSISFYDKDGVQRKLIEYKEGKLTTSIEYEVEDGQIVGQHVLGITGDTIRCAELDNIYDLSYYRIRYVRNFSNTIVGIKAINEFGEESMVTTKHGKMYRRTIIPPSLTSKTDKNSILYSISIFNQHVERLDKSRNVVYIHITDTTGTYYRQGIKDGDLLLSVSENNITVARPVKVLSERKLKGYYEKLHFTLEEGETGAVTYNVYYTEKEFNDFKESIK